MTPALTHCSDIVSDIPSTSTYILEVYSDILSDVLSGMYSDILSGILPGIYSAILSGIYAGILSGIYSDILSGMPDLNRKRQISVGAVEVRQCPLRSAARR